MKRKVAILFTYTLFIINSVHGQNPLYNLNNLPLTDKEVRAPVFDTFSKYFFKIDSTKNNLFIQDIRQSKQGEIHFYQWLNEIPLEELNSNSFQVKKQDNLISLEINSSSSILNYMFQEEQTISVATFAKKLELGPWDYTEALYSEMIKTVEAISTLLPNEKTQVDVKKDKENSGFKYIASKIQAVNPEIAKDSTIGNGYYFKQIVNDDGSMIYPDIVKKIKKVLKSEKIDIKAPLPIIIYATNQGVIESIICLNHPSEQYVNIDISRFEPIEIRNSNHPTKYTFLIK